MQLREKTLCNSVVKSLFHGVRVESVIFKTSLVPSSILNLSSILNPTTHMTLEELNTLLTDVLESEDYLRAIAIRDEINSRKKGK